MPYKSKYTREIGKVKKWAKKTRGTTVVMAYGQTDRFMPEDKLIIINTQQGERSQLFTLLHECGHLMNRDNKMQYKNGKYRLLAKSDDMGKLDKAAYNACAAKFIMTYVDWAAERQWDAPA
jgi:Zn-dependent peptidase ImmA (M78 family)